MCFCTLDNRFIARSIAYTVINDLTRNNGWLYKSSVKLWVLSLLVWLYKCRIRYCKMIHSLDKRLVTSTYATSSSIPRSTPHTGSSVAWWWVCVQESFFQLLALLPSTARSGTLRSPVELCQVGLFNATFVLTSWPADSATVIQDVPWNLCRVSLCFAVPWVYNHP